MRALPLALLLAVSPAFGATVPVDVVGIDEDVRLVQKDVTHRCHAPCTLDLAPGEWTLVAGAYEESLLVDGPATVRLRRGSSTGRMLGGGLAAGGALVVIGLTWALFSACEGRTRADGTYDYPCDRPAGRSEQLILVAGAGVGLAAMVGGGLLFFGSGPSLRVTERTRVGLAPALGGGALTFHARF